MIEQARQLKYKLIKQGIKGLALDIDETLSDTEPHWWNHMYKFITPRSATREELQKRHKYIEHVPDWQSDEARTYINDTLISSNFHETMPLLHESNTMVSKLNQLVPVVGYITARPTEVRGATENWLKKQGFPVAELIMRSGLDLETKNEWKAEVLAELYPEIIGIVDDNPDLANALEKLNYKGKLFLYGKQRQEIDPSKYSFEVIVSPSWDHVINHFQK